MTTRQPAPPPENIVVVFHGGTTAATRRLRIDRLRLDLPALYEAVGRAYDRSIAVGEFGSLHDYNKAARQLFRAHDALRGRLAEIEAGEAELVEMERVRAEA